MSSLQDIAAAFLLGFKNLSASEHIALRAENCTHIFAPSSIEGLPPPKSNQAFAEHLTNLRKLLVAFPVTAKEININEAQRQIVIWANGKPEFRQEAMGSDAKDEWDYTGEYIFILNLNGEGKIERIVEFLDSLATMRLLGLMKKARTNVGIGGHVFEKH